MLVRIKNLKLKTIIGIDDWERKKKQNIVINIEYEIKDSKAHKSDNINDTLNYRALNKEVIKFVKSSRFYLLEKLVSEILKIILKDKRVVRAKVEVDKPKALKYSDSVSIEMSKMS